LYKQKQHALQGMHSPEQIAKMYAALSCIAKQNSALIAPHVAEYGGLFQQQE